MNCGKMEKFIQMKSGQNREIQSNEYPILRFSQTKSGQNGEVQTNECPMLRYVVSILIISFEHAKINKANHFALRTYRNNFISFDQNGSSMQRIMNDNIELDILVLKLSESNRRNLWTSRGFKQQFFFVTQQQMGDSGMLENWVSDLCVQISSRLL